MQLQLEASSSGLKGEQELASTGQTSTATIHQASEHWFQATWITEDGRKVAGNRKAQLNAPSLELLFP